MRKKVPYLLAGAASLALLLAAVVHVAEGDLAVLSWRGGGTPTLLEPGFTLRFPLLQRLERYPGGRIEISRSAPVVSRDGDEVDLPFELRCAGTLHHPLAALSSCPNHLKLIHKVPFPEPT